MITRRGRIVRAIFIALLIGLALYYLNQWTTPTACKGKSPDQMNQICLDLVYPR